MEDIDVNIVNLEIEKIKKEINENQTSFIESENEEKDLIIEDNKKTKRPKKYEEKKNNCFICKKTQVSSNYYLTNSILFSKNYNGRLPICKSCLVDLYDEIFMLYEDSGYAMFILCRLLDAYYDQNLVQSAQIQATNTNSYLVRIYFQKINSMPQYKYYTFKDSSTRDITREEDMEKDNTPYLSEKDKSNLEEIIDLIGYDPFEDSDPSEKPYLYNTILSYLDERTVSDSFKLSAVIEIVKSFSQLEIINNLITTITKVENGLEDNISRYKILMDLKKNLQAQIMNYASANGITANKQKNETKGKSTFSGILKELRDKKIRPSDTNLFNIETYESFNKIAEISNKNIVQQLQLNEGDYSDMIVQQRQMLKNLESKYEELEEKNRLLLKENVLLKEELKKVGVK